MFDKLTVDRFRQHVDGLRVPRDIGCVFVHHTAGLRKYWHGHSSVVGIDNYHRDVRGWWGIGYNFLVDCNTPNTIWTGRPLSRTGAHALIEPHAAKAGRRWLKFSSSYPNVHGIGVCIPGSYDKERVDADCYDTLAQVVAIICDRFDLEHQYIGYHEEVANKSCPGSAYYFPKRSNFIELVRRYKSGGFGNAHFQMNDDPMVVAKIVDGTSFIRREDAEAIADKYNLRVPGTTGEDISIRTFLRGNSLPDPGFDPTRKLITGHTTEHWTNVRLIVNDVPAGRVWMIAGDGMARVEDVAQFSGWPESCLMNENGYIPLREFAEKNESRVVLSTEYWETQRKVYLYMGGEDFCAAETNSQHEVTPIPNQHT